MPAHFPHPAVVQVDQPARHAQQHKAAAAVPAQAALRPRAVLRNIAGDGASEVAARHVLWTLSFSGNCDLFSEKVLLLKSTLKEGYTSLRHCGGQAQGAGPRTSLTRSICTQPASAFSSQHTKVSDCNGKGTHEACIAELWLADSQHRS